jgi:hypothetical protein
VAHAVADHRADTGEFATTRHRLILEVIARKKRSGRMK